MFPFLAILIIFCLILSFYIRKSSAKQQQVQHDFFEKERLSNAVRKKDISKLDYINIPLDKILVKLGSSTEKNIFSLAEKPMLNFVGTSNTDLKLQYGTANLDTLMEYENNFLEFIALLPDYASELIAAGEKESALMLLEFAVSVNADSRKIDKLLAQLKEDLSSVN